ncbi:MAG: tRNA (N(6)-L-threonylcarbamoyladenosine(37)-C(2))-methylthiotransferase MtaB [Rickettsiales bacterium]|nr:tRNA (N(6)-L-threonylcarbamoyladenosine(37)-C(2))-methylthiotransferase MtaB [Rickettsiales bacterium]
MSHKVVTFGCRLNSFESEIIGTTLNNANLGEQHTVVFNSCAVTKEAERQLKQSIRKEKRQNPNSRIIVTGCAAQINPDKYVSMDEVDVVVGNNEKFTADNYDIKHEKKAIVNDIMSVKETASHLVHSFEGKTRAFIEIQNGCNHRCTFCIIPFGRGNSRSVPLGDLISQIRHLVESGYKEVVLTGVDITDYGKDLPGKPSLGEACKRILTLVPELLRLRLSSVDVAEIDPYILELIGSEPRFMPYLHISLQSGDNMILKRMKRRHTREQVIEFATQVILMRPEVTFGADIIAGFPTETHDMFLNTLNLIQEVPIVFTHIFPYSEREGTPAAKMPQVAKDIRKERAAILREAGQKNLRNRIHTEVGKTHNVIIEKHEIGRTENFLEFTMPGHAYPVGSVQQLTASAIQENRLAL